jgi:murein L,D-transpeptidase YcbB/YkuD
MAGMTGMPPEVPMEDPSQMGQQGDPMEELIMAIQQMAEQGASPEQVVMELLNAQIPPEAIMQALSQLGIPMEESQAMIEQVMGGGGMAEAGLGGQPPEMPMEDPMAQGMGPEMSPEQMAMAYGGMIKKKYQAAGFLNEQDLIVGDEDIEQDTTSVTPTNTDVEIKQVTPLRDGLSLPNPDLVNPYGDYTDVLNLEEESTANNVSSPVQPSTEEVANDTEVLPTTGTANLDPSRYSIGASEKFAQEASNILQHYLLPDSDTFSSPRNEEEQGMRDRYKMFVLSDAFAKMMMGIKDIRERQAANYLVQSQYEPITYPVEQQKRWLKQISESTRRQLANRMGSNPGLYMAMVGMTNAKELEKIGELYERKYQVEAEDKARIRQMIAQDAQFNAQMRQVIDEFNEKDRQGREQLLLEAANSFSKSMQSFRREDFLAFMGEEMKKYNELK